MSIKKTEYRVLQYSDGLFYAQCRNLLTWVTIDVADDLKTAKEIITAHKKSQEKPKVINVEYID